MPFFLIYFLASVSLTIFPATFLAAAFPPFAGLLPYHASLVTLPNSRHGTAKPSGQTSA
jgi:hypothetical protein